VRVHVRWARGFAHPVSRVHRQVRHEALPTGFPAVARVRSHVGTGPRSGRHGGPVRGRRGGAAGARFRAARSAPQTRRGGRPDRTRAGSGCIPCDAPRRRGAAGQQLQRQRCRQPARRDRFGRQRRRHRCHRARLRHDFAVHRRDRHRCRRPHHRRAGRGRAHGRQRRQVRGACSAAPAAACSTSPA